MTVKVQVTEEDLGKGSGRVGQPTGDPIWLAVQRVFPECSVLVGPAMVSIGCPGEKSAKFFRLPEAAQEFLRAYDIGNWEALDPITFEIEESDFVPKSGPTVVRNEVSMTRLLPRITRRIDL